MKLRFAFAFLAASVATAPAAVIQFNLLGTGGPGLLFSNEPGITSGGTGGEMLGGITFDNVSKLLTINVGWGTGNGFATNLTGASTNAHIHGPTTTANGNNFTEIAGTMINLQVSPAPGFNINTSASAGTITGTGTNPLTPAQETALMEGRTYLNVHTAVNTGGEIRGFLVPIPEPATAVVGMAALGALVLRRRRA